MFAPHCRIGVIWILAWLGSSLDSMPKKHWFKRLKLSSGTKGLGSSSIQFWKFHLLGGQIPTGWGSWALFKKNFELGSGSTIESSGSVPYCRSVKNFEPLCGFSYVLGAWGRALHVLFCEKLFDRNIERRRNFPLFENIIKTKLTVSSWQC